MRSACCSLIGEWYFAPINRYQSPPSPSLDQSTRRDHTRRLIAADLVARPMHADSDALTAGMNLVVVRTKTTPPLPSHHVADCHRQRRTATTTTGWSSSVTQSFLNWKRANYPWLPFGSPVHIIKRASRRDRGSSQLTNSTAIRRCITKIVQVVAIERKQPLLRTSTMASGCQTFLVNKLNLE